jgi:hypothetical protein
MSEVPAAVLDTYIADERGITVPAPFSGLAVTECS